MAVLDHHQEQTMHNDTFYRMRKINCWSTRRTHTHQEIQILITVTLQQYSSYLSVIFILVRPPASRCAKFSSGSLRIYPIYQTKAQYTYVHYRVQQAYLLHSLWAPLSMGFIQIGQGRAIKPKPDGFIKQIPTLMLSMALEKRNFGQCTAQESVHKFRK